MTWAARNSWSAPGIGKSNTVRRIVQPAEEAGLLLRLGARALHHGRGLLECRARGVCAPLRKGPDLPAASRIINWCPHCNTVHFRRRGGIRRERRLVSGTSAISAQRTATSMWSLATTRPETTAGRHGSRRAIPTTSAMRDLVGKTVDCCRWSAGKFRSLPTNTWSMDFGTGVREDHTRARPERL